MKFAAFVLVLVYSVALVSGSLFDFSVRRHFKRAFQASLSLVPFDDNGDCSDVRASFAAATNTTTFGNMVSFPGNTKACPRTTPCCTCFDKSTVNNPTTAPAVVGSVAAPATASSTVVCCAINPGFSSPKAGAKPPFGRGVVNSANCGEGGRPTTVSQGCWVNPGCNAGACLTAGRQKFVGAFCSFTGAVNGQRGSCNAAGQCIRNGQVVN